MYTKIYKYAYVQIKLRYKKKRTRIHTDTLGAGQKGQVADHIAQIHIDNRLNIHVHLGDGGDQECLYVTHSIRTVSLSTLKGTSSYGFERIPTLRESDVGDSVGQSLNTELI